MCEKHPPPVNYDLNREPLKGPLRLIPLQSSQNPKTSVRLSQQRQPIRAARFYELILQLRPTWKDGVTKTNHKHQRMRIRIYLDINLIYNHKRKEKVHQNFAVCLQKNNNKTKQKKTVFWFMKTTA